MAKTVESLRRLACASASAERVGLLAMPGEPVERVRHQLVDRFLSDATWTHLFFGDADQEFPEDTLDRLLALDSAIACLPVTIYAPRVAGKGRSGPGVTTNIWMHDSEAGTPATERVSRFLDPDEFPSGPFTCDGTGLACCLIAREVFERMAKPFFSFKFRNEGKAIGVSEDAYFFNKARELGYHIKVDPSPESVCEHYKEVDLTRLEDFFRDLPKRWPWRRDSKTNESLFIACLPEDNEILHETTLFLWMQQSQLKRPHEVFRTSNWLQSLKLSIRTFLAQQSEDWLLIIDGRTVPPDDFADRVISTSIPFASGLFRELVNGEPANGFLLRPSEHDGDPAHVADWLTEPLPVHWASLRATVIHRRLLEKIGTSWVPAHGGPREAGSALAEALCRSGEDSPQLVPIGCSHLQPFGLRRLLDAKLALKAELRQRNGAGS
ncbi:hypothetical protein Pan216_10540 [Planctomycetes bacterium Pan216]|uniref:Uncharacterized protein n=1 Tax=Kolteria novifilia TaxID=2527975 RepID=A0A518AZS3_9BACT|nr:hypothetical protein Pan216_10540 [Planctomycetes bacterium Pan216]